MGLLNCVVTAYTLSRLQEREGAFFIDNLLVRIHLIVEMEAISAYVSSLARWAGVSG